TRFSRDWSSDVCSSDLAAELGRLEARIRGDPLNQALDPGNTPVIDVEQDGIEHRDLVLEQLDVGGRDLLADVEIVVPEIALCGEIGRASGREGGWRVAT